MVFICPKKATIGVGTTFTAALALRKRVTFTRNRAGWRLTLTRSHVGWRVQQQGVGAAREILRYDVSEGNESVGMLVSMNKLRKLSE